MSGSKRDEWLRLMTELAQVDRDAYRRLRAEAWARVAAGHGEKSPDQLAEWTKNAS